MQQGTTGPLQSTTPPVTPAAWTSVFTGKNPGKHGIYDFQRIDRETYAFSTIRTHKHYEKTIWQLAGEQGKRSIIVDVPFTFPPQPLQGLMLTGYGTPRTPETVFTFPEDLAQRLPRKLRQEVRVALPEDTFDRSQRFIEQWWTIMAGRRALLQHFITQESWDLFMVVFSITDNMAHVFWTYADPAHPNYTRREAEEYREAFFGSYERCDQLVGDLMEAAGGETTTLIISDHGFGSVRPRQYLFQRLLHGGFLKSGAAITPAGTSSRWRASLLKVTTAAYARFPALRELVKGLRPGRRQLLKDTLQKVGALPNASAVDYERSQVILSNFGLQIWINDEKRFARGAVASEEREALIAELSNFLLSDVDPVTGQGVVRAVHRGRDVYEGPFVDECPDLIVEYNDLFGVRGQDGRRNGHTEGGHTHEGIFLAQGPHIRSSTLEGARLIDLAPTTLHLLGLLVPPDMDGRVLEEMFDDRFREERPVKAAAQPAVNLQDRAGTAYSDEEEADIREQLRQLGYL